MPRPGRAFERLMGALTILENRDPKFRVQSPAFLTDKVTGGQREIDILLSYGSGNAISTIAMECKDHTRPIDVKEIEAYTGKVADLDVDKAVMVSASGYTAPAVLKAAARGLIVQTVTQSARFDWTHTAGVLEDWVLISDLSVDALVGREWLPCRALYNPIGLAIPPENIFDAVGAALLSNPLNLERSEDDSTKRPNDALVTLGGIGGAEGMSGLKFPSQHARARGIVYFSRSFKTLGYYENRTEGADDPRAFARAKLAAGKGEFSELVLSELSPDRAGIIIHDHSGIASGARGRISLVTWPELHGRLMEVKGLRHHIGLSARSDLQSVAKFMHNFDPAGRDQTYDGDLDAWAHQDLKRDDIATIAVREEDIAQYRPPANVPRGGR